MPVRFKPETPLSYFKETLLNSADNAIHTVDFYTITGASIPLCETVADVNDYPILCQINSTRTFALNFSLETQIEQVDSHYLDEEQFFEFASGVGLKGYQRFLYGNFAHKMMNTLPRSEQINKQQISESIAQVLRYYTYRGYKVEGSLTELSLHSIKQRAISLSNDIANREQQLNVIRRSSARKATALCWLGSSIAIGQLGFIAAGTFHYLSWDIMEPICYCMTLGNFTIGYFFYLAMKQDLELTSVHSILTHRMTVKAAKR